MEQPQLTPEKIVELQNKARERTVKTTPIDYDLETLVKKIEKGSIKLDPDYQRRHRWGEEVSSRLIESLILNVPIPIIYISQDLSADQDDSEGEARYTVIDGQQRLRSIRDFMTNKFPLSGLETLSDINGLRYSQLPIFLTRRLEERTIRCLRVDSSADTQLKFDIFERLNSGAVELSAQELRNATVRGDFNNLIKSLSKNKTFQLMLQIDPKNADDNTKIKKMMDVELVLRFFALYREKFASETFPEGFGIYLTREMQRLTEECNSEDLLIMKGEFEKTVEAVHTILGDLAFAKYRKNGGGKYASKFNAAVYDAVMLSVYSSIDLNKPHLSEKKKEDFLALFNDETFSSAISGSVNDKSKIVARIRAVEKVFR
ncbi:DUF262 domain-containing protein [Deinococcus cavernae]|uniref:DUF262 domain-containing protein n=1 Tax=Deinococcus cavernae TaxID=2320857 RepID=A0A418VAP6_9DEIO|nr:DUF262 domain-containing protein [Deinococcus cavernae]RJF73106.1 DUF262 domain-containing protein [Deinococcus cavernae]